MANDIFRLKNEDGTDGEWAYFSESKGDIVNVGMDEQVAQQRAAADGPKTTIAQALANDTSTSKPLAHESNQTVDTKASDSSSSKSDNDPVTSVGASGSSYTLIPPLQSSQEQKTIVTEAKPARPPLSPVFIKKLVEQLGRNTTNISIEFERFVFKLTGYTTEELAEDDADVEIIRMGWDAIWQSYLAGKDPPLWMVLAFGYSCTTMRLVASAKRIEKKVREDGDTTDETH